MESNCNKMQRPGRLAKRDDLGKEKKKEMKKNAMIPMKV